MNVSTNQYLNKSTFLLLFLFFASNVAMAQLPKPYAPPNTKPIVVTELIKTDQFAQKQFANKRDSTDYYHFSIDEQTFFHRCSADTQLVGYVLVPTGFDSLYMKDRINRYGNTIAGWNGKELHYFGYGSFKQDITLEDVKRAENALAAAVNGQYDFKSIRKRYKDYGRQYVFFYDENNQLCVLVNCSCEKYDWLFSRRYCYVHDGGDCYWRMVINLETGKTLYVSVNGEG